MSTARKDLYADRQFVRMESSMDTQYEEITPTLMGNGHFIAPNCQAVFENEQKRNKKHTDTCELNVRRLKKMTKIVIIIAIMFVSCAFVALTAITMIASQQTTIKELQTTMENLRNRLAQLEENATLCIPCAELSLGPYPEDTPDVAQLLKHVENGQQICCAKTANQTSFFLNLVGRSHVQLGFQNMT
ncbi:hypothetical protein DPMN_133002 [Dreissena polymorpha]|uniref:Uncharacterized protein n=1 Tax=Dreissena polymorpha TaxID=45954 RepID=A0A9D4FSP5_DREPO|nr:hypothetical protein DPMN_133002 [Dreissena polymorpha]